MNSGASARGRLDITPKRHVIQVCINRLLGGIHYAYDQANTHCPRRDSRGSFGAGYLDRAPAAGSTPKRDSQVRRLHERHHRHSTCSVYSQQQQSVSSATSLQLPDTDSDSYPMDESLSPFAFGWRFGSTGRLLRDGHRSSGYQSIVEGFSLCQPRTR